MTRQQGIIKAWQLKNPNSNDLTELDKLCEFEYLNYLDQCDACHEKPKTIDEYLNEKITPLK